MWAKGFLNHKGGVGKTTSTVNIGAGLALTGHKVLLIDMDPQSNMTQSYGISKADVSVYEVLKGEAEARTVEAFPNLDILPSSLDLSGAEMELINEAGREYLLKDAIAGIKDKYDYILIDCPPSLGLLTINHQDNRGNQQGEKTPQQGRGNHGRVRYTV